MDCLRLRACPCWGRSSWSRASACTRRTGNTMTHRLISYQDTRAFVSVHFKKACRITSVNIQLFFSLPLSVIFSVVKKGGGGAFCRSVHRHCLIKIQIWNLLSKNGCSTHPKKTKRGGGSMCSIAIDPFRAFKDALLSHGFVDIGFGKHLRYYAPSTVLVYSLYGSGSISQIRRRCHEHGFI